ncbi:MAG: putative addiction module antidote protein [Nitrospinae bacterium]|nr:putative addiction module antidote protein [Nitrospinota bacterium]
MREWLADIENAAAYLNESLENGNREEFLDALKMIANAQGIGVRGVAKATGLSRESLFRSLSKNGNPSSETLMLVMEPLGLGLRVEALSKTGKKNKPSAGKVHRAHAG